MALIVSFVYLFFAAATFTLDIPSTNDCIASPYHHDNDIFFKIENIENVSLPIDIIGEIYQFSDILPNGSFRCLRTSAPFATDFGPYQKLYLIYDNGFGLPHRLAIYEIGNLARINS